MKNYTREQWANHFNKKSRSHFDTKPGYQGDAHEMFGCSVSEIEATEKHSPNHSHTIKPFDGINEALIRAGVQHMKKTMYVKGREA